MFDKIQTMLASFLIICIFTQNSIPRLLTQVKSVKNTRESEVDYDRYLLATSWAGATCKFHSCKHYGSDEVFNLHGLWPSTAGKSPQNCSTVNFQEENLSPNLKKTIYLYWNSFYHDNWEFLNHEITKHGSCWRPDYGDMKVMDKKLADIIQSYDSSDDYSKINTFLTLTLKLSKIVDPYRILKTNGIIPGDSKSYPIDDILNIFSGLYQKNNTVMPVCLAEKTSGKLYLSELRFCLDLDFAPIKCNPGEMSRQLKRCRESPVHYPSFPNHK